MEPLVTFVAVAFNETIQAHTFCSSLIAQKDDRWQAIIYCNGPNEELKGIVNYYQDKSGGKKFIWAESEQNSGFWGCYNRVHALRDLVDTRYIINTSIQDYYTPNAVEELLAAALGNPRYCLLYFNCIHNHKQYDVLHTEPYAGYIDWGSFMIKTDLAKSVGINYPESEMADGKFVNQVTHYMSRKHPLAGMMKINKILTVHN